METKCCTRCDEIKSISEFCYVKLAKDNLNWVCKKCDVELAKELRQRYRNGELPYKYVEYKVCSDCKISKPRDQFHKYRASATGLDYRCIPCKKIKARKSYLKKQASTNTPVKYGLISMSNISIIDEFKRAKIIKDELYTETLPIIDIAAAHRCVLISRVVNNNPKFKIVKADEIIANKLLTTSINTL